MKTILAVWHGAGKGKSDTLRQFANAILLSYPSHRPIFPIPMSVPTTGDFRCIVEINGKIYGIESQGDPGTGLKKRLYDLADLYHCDVILCSTRTRGETVQSVEEVCRMRQFDSVWTSTYQVTSRANHNIVNRLKGNHIHDLLNTLGLI